MWWYCGYRALPTVSGSDLARRFLRQHDAGTNQPANVRGWFMFSDGVSGFVLIEADTAKQLAGVLEPYAKLVEWQVEGVSELNYNQVLEELRHSTQRAAIEDMMAGTAPSAGGAL